MLDESSGRLKEVLETHSWHVSMGTPMDGLLCAVPNVAVVQDWRQKEVEKHDNCEGIACDVEGSGQWCTSIVDLSPVETDGEQAQTGVHLEVIPVS